MESDRINEINDFRSQDARRVVSDFDIDLKDIPALSQRIPEDELQKTPILELVAKHGYPNLRRMFASMSIISYESASRSATFCFPYKAGSFRTILKDRGKSMKKGVKDSDILYMHVKFAGDEFSEYHLSSGKEFELFARGPF
tara:strand:+ start:232 stop:657 length:426 start_codon:yes stop_codon:yes gene_type:complete